MLARRQQGFSLIEILVAFVILAMSLTVTYRIFSGGLRNVALSEDYTHAVLVAESQLATIGVSESLEPGVSSGEWGDGFYWELIVKPYQPWQQDKELTTPVLSYWVTVNVNWEHEGHSRQLRLNSLRLKPVEQAENKG